MEQNWGLYNNYYSGDRPPPVSPQQDRMDEGPSHRRGVHQGGFIPPPPPVTLPPVSTSYPSSYHGSSPGNVTMASAGPSTAGPSTGSMHMPPTMQYSSHMNVSQQPVGAYHYPLQSQGTMSALPPGRSSQSQYSPRHASYPSASPAMNQLSPLLSPSAHMSGYAASSSTTTSASSFPPVPPTHSRIDPPIGDHRARRTNSESGGSWNDERKDDDDQPWGMPQEQYKALNPRDKKQVRNRIGARKFRAKKKNYVTQLEKSKEEADLRIARLESIIDAQWRELNDYRGRLNLGPQPRPDTSSSTLGLSVGSGEP